MDKIENLNEFVCVIQPVIKFPQFLCSNEEMEQKKLIDYKNNSPVLKRSETIGRATQFAKQQFRSGFMSVLTAWGIDEELTKKLDVYLESNTFFDH